ncbi:unnamed protein product [Pedinophyceae sp. YPF-701]|nr:unnamed protein product [Pedinophyceae sp. YPF-701]
MDALLRASQASGHEGAPNIFASAPSTREMSAELRAAQSTVDLLSSQFMRSMEQCKDVQKRLAAAGRMCKELERIKPRCTDAAVQASLDASGTPLQGARITASAPFQFARGTRRIDWARLRGINVDEVVDGINVEAALSVLEDVAFGDLAGESPFNMNEGNLTQLCRLGQLIVQFLIHERRQAAGRRMADVQQRDLMMAMLSRLDVEDQRSSVQGLPAQMARMEDEIRRLGAEDMDALADELRRSHAL